MAPLSHKGFHRFVINHPSHDRTKIIFARINHGVYLHLYREAIYLVRWVECIEHPSGGTGWKRSHADVHDENERTCPVRRKKND